MNLVYYRYMYAGKIDHLNTRWVFLGRHLFARSPEFFNVLTFTFYYRSPRLLEAADKYQLSELKEICEVDFLK